MLGGEWFPHNTSIASDASSTSYSPDTDNRGFRGSPTHPVPAPSPPPPCHSPSPPHEPRAQKCKKSTNNNHNKKTSSSARIRRPLYRVALPRTPPFQGKRTARLNEHSSPALPWKAQLLREILRGRLSAGEPSRSSSARSPRSTRGCHAYYRCARPNFRVGSIPSRNRGVAQRRTGIRAFFDSHP